MSVSGGYGPSASGSTDNNGTFGFSIKPINLGGPYPLTFSITSPYGNLSTISQSIRVVASMNPTISLSGSISVEWGMPYSLTALLDDMMGNPMNSQSITITSPTDGTASYSNISPSGPSTTATGSITQTTGTYAPGSISVNASFDQVGNQTLTATQTATGISKSIIVQVAPSVVTNIFWTSVTPTTISAGSTVSISGQALNSIGNGVMPGTAIQLFIGTQNVTAYTTTNGMYSATLTPTIVGTYTLQAKATGNTFNYGTVITVNHGSFASGTVNLATAPFMTGDTVTASIHMQDACGNPISGVKPTISITGSGAPGATQPGTNTDNSGNLIVNEGPFANAGTYTIWVSYGGVSISSGSFAVTAPVPANIVITDNNPYAYIQMFEYFPSDLGYPYPAESCGLQFYNTDYHWYSITGAYLYYTVTVTDNKGKPIPNTQVNFSLTNLITHLGGGNSWNMSKISFSINGAVLGYSTTSSFYSTGTGVFTTDSNGQISITTLFTPTGTNSNQTGYTGATSYNGTFKVTSAVAPSVSSQITFASTTQY